MDAACIDCSSEVRPRQHALQCDECDRWQHRKCNSGISVVQYRVMMKQQRDGVDVSLWFCKGCTNRQPSDVEKAVTALLALVNKKKKVTNIVDHQEKVDLQLTLKVIPTAKHKAIKLDIPHSLHYDTREVCLFVKDLDRDDREYEKTVEHFQDYFKKNGVTNISKIVPLKALRTDYSLDEDRRSLAKAYDLYLADERIIGMLPGALGKNFYEKKKTWPVQVNLKAADLKKTLDNIIHNSRLVIDGKGSSCMGTVGHDRMTEEQIVDNILAAASIIKERVPGGPDNIRSILIKCTDSLSIPLHSNIGGNSKIELNEVKEKELDYAIDDVTTVEGAQVYIRADGYVKVIRKRDKSRDNVGDGRGRPSKKVKLHDKKDTVGKKKGANNKKQKVTGKTVKKGDEKTLILSKTTKDGGVKPSKKMKQHDKKDIVDKKKGANNKKQKDTSLTVKKEADETPVKLSKAVLNKQGGKKKLDVVKNKKARMDALKAKKGGTDKKGEKGNVTAKKPRKGPSRQKNRYFGKPMIEQSTQG